MGCNCKQAHTPPAGMNGQSTTSSQSAETPPARVDADVRLANAGVASGGGMSAPKGTTQTFTLSTNKGTFSYGSLLEAEAARVRNGGQGRIAPINR